MRTSSALGYGHANWQLCVHVLAVIELPVLQFQLCDTPLITTGISVPIQCVSGSGCWGVVGRMTWWSE